MTTSGGLRSRFMLGPVQRPAFSYQTLRHESQCQKYQQRYNYQIIKLAEQRYPVRYQVQR